MTSYSSVTRGRFGLGWVLIALTGLVLMGCASDETGRSSWVAGLSEDGRPNPARTRRQGGASTTALEGSRGQGSQPLLVYGNDEFVSQAHGRIPKGAQLSDDGILINFEDAELRDVVKTILGDLLKQNYLFDPRVQGRITLQTVSPLSEPDTLAALELVLRQNGAALIKRNDIFTIVPVAEASSGATTPILADGAISLQPGYAVMVAPLRNASASELAGVLEPLAGAQTTIRFDAARNVLIMAGAASELASLRETIALFDVDWLEGLSYGLFPLRKARAEVLVEELRTILGGPNSPIKDQVVLEPVTRLNAVLIVTKRRNILENVRQWVGRLDKDTGVGRDGVYVYRVENVRAKDIAEALSQVFDTGPVGSIGGSSGTADGAETVTISIGADGQPIPVSAPVSAVGNSGSGIKVFANEANNSLVIRAEPDTYNRILSIIKELDTAPLQVLIDATIAEVAITDQLNYGVQFYLNKNSTSATSSNSNSGSRDGAFPGFVASYVTGGAEVVLSALDSITRLNVISTPRIMVLDNQSARLNVGDEVPIITQQQQSSNGNSNIVNQVSFRQTGIVLEVKPRVNSSGLVTLDILQETSNVVDDNSTGSLTPTISQRTIESSIAVQNGQTILLGGLMQQSSRAGKSGVPVLSDVPILGGLFGTRRTASDRTELIVMLTPRVVRNPNEVRDMTEELRRRMQNMPPEFFPKNSLTQRARR